MYGDPQGRDERFVLIQDKVPVPRRCSFPLLSQPAQVLRLSF